MTSQGAPGGFPTGWVMRYTIGVEMTFPTGGFTLTCPRGGIMSLQWSRSRITDPGRMTFSSWRWTELRFFEHWLVKKYWMYVWGRMNPCQIRPKYDLHPNYANGSHYKGSIVK